MSHQIVYCYILMLIVCVMGNEEFPYILQTKIKQQDSLMTYLNDTSIKPICLIKNCFIRLYLDYDAAKRFYKYTTAISRETTFVAYDFHATTQEVDCFVDDDSTYWHLGRINSRSSHSFPYEHIMNRHFEGNGAEVTAYVVDTGIYLNHSAFGDRARHLITGPDAFLVDNTDDDLSGHGTHVAGSLGGLKFGSSSFVSLVSIKSGNRFGSFTEMDILVGIEAIINDVLEKNMLNGKAFRVVVNMSFGSNHIAPAIEAAIRELYDLGIPVVTASGNENQGSCVPSPGRMPEVINVAATNEQDELSAYSNWATCIDILAPGDNIVSAAIGTSTSVRTDSGTSYSAPLVAGVIANYLSSHEYVKSPEEIRSWLSSSSTADVIDMVQIYKDETPNRLLFSSCTLYEYTATTLEQGETEMTTEEQIHEHQNDCVDQWWCLLLIILAILIGGAIVIWIMGRALLLIHKDIRKKHKNRVNINMEEH